MEVMLSLEGSALNSLRASFNKAGGSLTIDEFVRLMLATLPRGREKMEITKDMCEVWNASCVLCRAGAARGRGGAAGRGGEGRGSLELTTASSAWQLFAQIDVNGDGTLEWEEFTSYCVEAGIVATRQMKLPIKFKYVEKAYVDTTSRGLFIRAVRMEPALGALTVIEANSPRVRLYDPRSMRLLAREINLMNLPSVKNDAVERQPVALCAVYVAEAGAIAVTSSDLTLSVWSAADFTCLNSMHTRTPQTVLAYGEGTLYSAGTDGAIYLWKLDGTAHYASIGDCTEVITSIVVVSAVSPAIMLAASMDHRVLAYEVGSTKQIAVMAGGHQRGITHMVYSAECAELLTAGFDLEAVGWDLKDFKAKLRLRGHRYSLVGISLLTGTAATASCCITGDDRGYFKLWDVRPTPAGLAACLLSFSVANDVNMFVPACFTVAHGSGNIIAAAMKMHVFVQLQVSPSDTQPTLGLYNPTYRQFVTVADRSLRMFDECGRVCQKLPNLTDTNVTAVCLDDRARKVIVGCSDGRIQVYNFLNGALMKDCDVKHRRDVTAVVHTGADRCIITASWDRRLHVYDENYTSSLVLLRAVEDAHATDILCAAYSRSSSIIATAAADGSVHVWNFQTMKLEGVLLGHPADIADLCFVEPYALLFSADSSGHLVGWGVGRRGSVAHRNRCVFATRNTRVEAEAGHEGVFVTELRRDEPAGAPVPLCCVRATDAPSGGAAPSQPGGAAAADAGAAATAPGGEGTAGGGASRRLLLTGDDAGVVKVYDLGALIAALSLEAIPDAKQAWFAANYNPRQRVRRGPPAAEEVAAARRAAVSLSDTVTVAGASTAGLPKPMRGPEVLPVVAAWQAHHDGIIDMCVIAEPAAVQTLALDNSVKLFSLGARCQEVRREPPPLAGDDEVGASAPPRAAVTYPVGHPMGIVHQSKRARAALGGDASWLFTVDNGPRDARAIALAREILRRLAVAAARSRTRRGGARGVPVASPVSSVPPSPGGADGGGDPEVGIAESPAPRSGPAAATFAFPPTTRAAGYSGGLVGATGSAHGPHEAVVYLGSVSRGPDYSADADADLSVGTGDDAALLQDGFGGDGEGTADTLRVVKSDAELEACVRAQACARSRGVWWWWCWWWWWWCWWCWWWWW